MYVRDTVLPLWFGSHINLGAALPAIIFTVIGTNWKFHPLGDPIYNVDSCFILALWTKERMIKYHTWRLK
jgi:hypothetical protein